MSNKRMDRISSEYMRAMAQALRTVKDPRVSGLTSITRCEVTGDLRYAKVYISVLGGGDEKALLKGLKTAAGYLRRTAAASLTLRAAPEPLFYLDDSIRRGAAILEKLQTLEYAPDAEPSTESSGSEGNLHENDNSGGDKEAFKPAADGEPPAGSR